MYKNSAATQTYKVLLGDVEGGSSSLTSVTKSFTFSLTHCREKQALSVDLSSVSITRKQHVQTFERNLGCRKIHFTCSSIDTYVLALLFGFKAVVIAITTAIPELCASVGLFVIIPANDVLSTAALTQNKITTRIRGESLCEGEKTDSIKTLILFERFSFVFGME